MKKMVQPNGKLEVLISNYLQNEKFDCMNIVFDTRKDQHLPRKMIQGEKHR